MRCVRSWAWPVLALLVLLPTRAPAFCPTNGMRCGAGGVGVTHEDLTRQAFETLSTELFGSPKQTRAMREAREEIWKANAEVDEDQTNGFKHFDGESFAPGKQRLVTLFQGALGSLRAEDAPAARRQLGQALHTLQDFYSHSNWTESGRQGAEPALWRPELPLPPSAGSSTATCQACELVLISDGSLVVDCGRNVVTPLLTSGYYGGENEVPPSSSKCRHGGPFDTGPGPFGGINKDTQTQALSPHFPLHRAAADSALAASEQFIRDLAAQLTERQRRLLFGVGPTLALALDTTGDMASLLPQVSSQVSRFLESRRGTEQEPSRYLLVLFNGATTWPLLATNEPRELERALASVTPRAGGDCSGMSMTAALQVLGAADRATELFLLTRSAARDAALAPSVTALAQAKEARVHTLLFGACASGEPAYTHVTTETGGQRFSLQFTDAALLVPLVDACVRAQGVDLLSLPDARGGGTFQVPVDSTLSRVTFSLSGSASLGLTRPDGSPVRAGEPGVQRLQLPTATLVTVLAPRPGRWTLSLGASAASSLRVLGESPVALDRFELVTPRGRPGHQGYAPLLGPLPSVPVTVAAELSASVASVRFELRSRTGALLQVVPLAPEVAGLPGELFGTLGLPVLPFTVQGVGTLPGGEPFQRSLPRPGGLLSPGGW